MSGYKPEQSGEFYRQLKQALDSMPGVESSALAIVPVLAGNEWDSSMTVEGYNAPAEEGVDPHMNYVSPDYFRTLGVSLLDGRDFTSRDDANAPPVAIVNERFAKRYFAGRNPIGGHIGMGGDPGAKTPIEVVGVVHDTRYENLRSEVPYEVYIPYRQNTTTGCRLMFDASAIPPKCWRRCGKRSRRSRRICRWHS